MRAEAHVVEFPQGCPSPDAFAARTANRVGTVVLESLHDISDYGRYSIVSFDPVATLECRDEHGCDPLEIMRDTLFSFDDQRFEVPFVGGWMGFLGYEIGRRIERLPSKAARDLGIPDAVLGLYDTVAVFDRVTRSWTVAGVDLPAPWGHGRPTLDHRLAALADELRRTAPLEPPQLWNSGRVIAPEYSSFVRKVCQIQDHIAAGDIYQANLTERVRMAAVDDAWSLYRRLRVANPSNYAAFINCGDFSILSSSPELFLDCRDGMVTTRPIKGTAPRDRSPQRDDCLRAALAVSEKDLAELAMIVDLERNDLGKVCNDVIAQWPPQLETHPTVHHLVGHVRGRLVEGRSPIDVLRATFPCGSITGAPKIRAMEIIDDLEPVARGPYCGGIGYVGLDGSMSFNVAIRTMVVSHCTAYGHVGAGIVADSDPEKEYAEILAKFQGMAAALGGMSPAARMEVA